MSEDTKPIRPGEELNTENLQFRQFKSDILHKNRRNRIRFAPSAVRQSSQIGARYGA
jgi:hypothetical protein